MNWLTSLLSLRRASSAKSRRSGRSARQNRQAGRRHVLHLEALESRQLLAVHLLAGTGLDVAIIDAQNFQYSLNGGPIVTVNDLDPVCTLIFNGQPGPTNTLIVADDPLNLLNEMLSGGIVFNAAGSSNTLYARDLAQTWNITGVNQGNVMDGVNPTGIQFNNVQHLVGGTDDDAFVITTGAGVGSVNGGLGAATFDSLIAPDSNNLWQLNGATSGTLNGVAFQNIQDLFGGAANDVFRFAPAAAGFNTVDGGLGSNTLDYSSYGAQSDVDLSSFTAPALTFFFNFDRVKGSVNPSNTLTDTAAGAFWQVTTPNAGIVMGTNVVMFSGFPNLVGGGLFDTFLLSNPSSRVTSLTGGGVGNGDVLFAANIPNTWNLTGADTGTLNGPTFTFTGIDNLVGNGRADTFVFLPGASFDFIYGVWGTGTNTLDYSSYGALSDVDLTLATAPGLNMFVDINVVKGSADPLNTLTDSAPGAIWNVTGLNAGTVAGSLPWLVTFSGFPNLVGDGSSDTFTLANPASVVTSITGGGPFFGDTLVAANMANTWTLLPIPAVEDGNLNGIAFTGIDNLTGGTAADTFLFLPLASYGVIDGGAGSDTFDYSGYTGPITVDVQLGTADGVVSFSSIETFLGSGDPGDTLIGPDALWNITGLNAGTVVSATTTTFSSFENLTGGLGDDTFVLKTSAAYVSGVIDGGGGTNTMAAFVTNNSWYLYGPNTGDLNHMGGGFTNIQNLWGSSMMDWFQFQAGASGFGTVNGGGGSSTNTMDFSLFFAPVTVDLQAKSVDLGLTVANFVAIKRLIGSGTGDTLIGPDVNNVWNINGLDLGTVGTVSFSAFANLTGGAVADTFYLRNAGAFLSGGIDGGLGTNTLVGFNMANSWFLSGLNAGLLNAMPFGNVNNLTGGTGADTFTFGGAASGFGTVNGMVGTNTMDFSLFGVPVTVDLQGKKVNGGSVVANFVSIKNLTGSGTGDTLIGPDVNNVWKITGGNSGTVAGLNFSSFANLQGGLARDTFQLNAGPGGAGTLSGTIAGGGAKGTNVLDYSYRPSFLGGVIVNLGTGVATGVGGGVSGIGIVVGSRATDVLKTSGLGGEVLIGGAGDDSLDADPSNLGVGRDLLVGGSGADLLNGSAAGSILVGGTVSYYSESTKVINIAALNAIMAEWTGPSPYALRVAHLFSGGGLNGSSVLNSSTVHNDGGAADALFGNLPPVVANWYLYSVGDSISGDGPGEQKTLI